MWNFFVEHNQGRVLHLEESTTTYKPQIGAVFLLDTLMSIYGGFVKFLFSFLVLFAAAFSTAAPLSSKIPYYGTELYESIASGATNEELKSEIKYVLKSYHSAVPGKADQIVDRCSGRNCYSQVSVGYDRARIFLMGVYYLIDHGNGNYGVRDLYCDNEKTSNDFRGDNGPGPEKVPSANVINTEHTWPQSKFSGRHDRGLQKADLHHLFPTDSQVNSTRGSYNFGEVGRDTKPVKCGAARFGTATDGTRDVFEPPQNHKGNVARALFYFSLRYDMPINASEESYLRAWSKEDPVDEDEQARNNAIYNIQFNRNPFIDIEGLEDRIDDF